MLEQPPLRKSARQDPSQKPRRRSSNALVDEFIEDIAALPDYLDVNVNVNGAPALHVLYLEVGMKKSRFVRVGGPDYANPTGGSDP